MNRLTAKQLLMINQKLTNQSEQATDALMKNLEEISTVSVKLNKSSIDFTLKSSLSKFNVK